MNERRLDARYMCADMVTVEWRFGYRLNGRENPRRLEAVLEDISSLGACVQVEEVIPIGSLISISTQRSHFLGEVSYCVFRDYGYFVGIRFADETRWSVGKFSPQHLTDLRTFVGSNTDEEIVH
jgi:hypothetical protein